MKCIIPFCLLPITAFADFIGLSSVDGNSIEAKVLSQTSNSVTIERRDGQVFDVPLDRFSKTSQELIQTALNTGNGWLTASETLNKAFGLALFGETPFWSESENTIVSRIRWPQESKTSTSSSYRVYPGPKATLLGRRPYSAVIYFKNGRPDMASFVFANKGDTFEEAQSARDVEKFISDAIEADGEAISNLLTGHFGEAERQSFGEGRGTRQRIQRWDVSDISILLTNQENEYVGVQIVSKTLADNKGVQERISDSQARQVAESNVLERPNGDIIIQNIPMVNQGPKGYCAPATLERYLRYMGLTADMYLLALAGQTGLGGGTSSRSLLDGVSSMLTRNNRSLEEVRKMPEIQAIKRYIDRGQPLMWTLFSTPSFNQISNERTRMRENFVDTREWSRALRPYRNQVDDLAVTRTDSHMAMIIGYNDETGEIAFSDSWGPEYAERWLTEEELVAFSQGFNYVVDF